MQRLLRCCAAAPEIEFLLEVVILRGRDLALPPPSPTGASRPFVVVSIGDQTYRTSLNADDCNPKWDERIVTFLLKGPQSVSVALCEHDASETPDVFLGRADLALEAQPVNEYQGQALALRGPTGAPVGALDVLVKKTDRKGADLYFWEHVFRIADSDGSGTLDKDEFRVAYCLLMGRTPVYAEDWDRLFAAVDTDGDQKISAAEMMEMRGYGTQKQDHRAFSGTGDHDIALRAMQLRKAHQETLGISPDADLSWFVAMDFARHEAAQGDNSVARVLLSQTGWLPPPGAAGPERCESSPRRLWWHSQARTTPLSPTHGTTIVVKDRETGEWVVEKIPHYLKAAMSLMYGGPHRCALLEMVHAERLLRKVTCKHTARFHEPESAEDIPGFVEYHELNMDEALHPVSHFNTFNDFFSRRLKPDARPIHRPADAACAVLPADARTLVFSSVAQSQELWIKGENFALETLLQDAGLAGAFAGGALMISRLAPQDYHRFHFPVTGTVARITHIAGEYYTVNPVAVRSGIDVYGANRRALCVVETAHFGRVCVVVIGATMVGSIVFTCREGAAVAKGDEMGYFAFGGSTLVTLFPQGAICFDEDLRETALVPMEMLGRMGTSCGRAAAAVPGAHAPASPAPDSVVPGVPDLHAEELCS